MASWIIGLLGALALFLWGVFTTKKANKETAAIIDLTTKINQNKAKATDAQKDADAKTKTYLDELSKLDPNFHNDDGDGNKPAS